MRLLLLITTTISGTMTCIPSEQYRIALRQYVGCHDVDCLCESKPIVKTALGTWFWSKNISFQTLSDFRNHQISGPHQEVEPYSLRLFDDLEKNTAGGVPPEFSQLFLASPGCHALACGTTPVPPLEGAYQAPILASYRMERLKEPNFKTDPISIYIYVCIWSFILQRPLKIEGGGF